MSALRLIFTAHEGPNLVALDCSGPGLDFGEQKMNVKQTRPRRAWVQQ